MTAELLQSAASQTWDAVVIGAGPAGAVAGTCLARAGAKVLIVEQKSCPRRKVCGGCLNPSALQALDQAGLTHYLQPLKPVPLSSFELRAGGRRLQVPLPAGIAISREVFDACLIAAACETGAKFLPETRAMVGSIQSEYRTVSLQHNAAHATVLARVVLTADGLHHSSLSQQTDHRPQAHPKARLGAGCLLDETPADYLPGVIYMAVGSGGYVGLTCVEQGRLNVAAALDASLVQRCGTLAQAADCVMAEAGFPRLLSLHDAKWQGTPPLTRRTGCLADERLFVLGDAAGYIEPFTGEGMAWAIGSALQVTPLALSAIQGWHPRLVPEWTRLYRRTVLRRQFLCRSLAWLLRHPRLFAPSLQLLSALPSLPRAALYLMNH